MITYLKPPDPGAFYNWHELECSQRLILEEYTLQSYANELVKNPSIIAAEIEIRLKVLKENDYGISQEHTPSPGRFGFAPETPTS